MEQSMSDNKPAHSLDLLSKSMNERAREIGAMDPDEPRRAELLKELSGLTVISLSLKAERK